ncbi:hypothetical protein TNCV_730492 [Trichonephila clavipes]|nr:hypothetical protein TNCV_730492 [Trichonephila clavipes]
MDIRVCFGEEMASQRVGQDTLRIHSDLHLNNFAIEGKTRPFLRLNGTMVIEQMVAVMKRGKGPLTRNPGPSGPTQQRGGSPLPRQRRSGMSGGTRILGVGFVAKG